MSSNSILLKIYDHKCCNGRVWFLHEQFGFSLQYWHEQGFLLVWVLSLKWNLVQSSRFQCPHCKSKFSQKHNLKRHVKQKPEENVPLLEDFKCTLCSKVFSTTLESGIDVGQGINVGPGKFARKNKRRALNKHSELDF